MERQTSNPCFLAVKIAAANLRHNFLPHFAAAILLVLLAPVLFGTRDLNRLATAVPFEMFVSLIGIALLTPIFEPEQDPEIRDLVEAKYVSPLIVYFLRTVYSILSVLFLLALFYAYLSARGCAASPPILMGAMANATFLGGLGMFFASLARHAAIGYVVPMAYFAANFGAKEILGDFYLFSMSAGQFDAKPWLFLSGLLLILLAHASFWLRTKLR